MLNNGSDVYLKAKRVPGADPEYRYYMVKDTKAWFSEDCSDWTRVTDLPDGDWRIADMCDGPGPAVIYENGWDGQPARVAVGDMDRFDVKIVPDAQIYGICVGMSNSGLAERDYVTMAPDLANCACAAELARLAYPSGESITLTKSDVYFPNSTSYSGFTAPDAGWIDICLSCTAVGVGGQLVMTPPDEVAARFAF